MDEALGHQTAEACERYQSNSRESPHAAALLKYEPERPCAWSVTHRQGRRSQAEAAKMAVALLLVEESRDERKPAEARIPVQQRQLQLALSWWLSWWLWLW